MSIVVFLGRFQPASGQKGFKLTANCPRTDRKEHLRCPSLMKPEETVRPPIPIDRRNAAGNRRYKQSMGLLLVLRSIASR